MKTCIPNPTTRFSHLFFLRPFEARDDYAEICIFCQETSISYKLKVPLRLRAKEVSKAKPFHNQLSSVVIIWVVRSLNSIETIFTIMFVRPRAELRSPLRSAGLLLQYLSASGQAHRDDLHSPEIRSGSWLLDCVRRVAHENKQNFSNFQVIFPSPLKQILLSTFSFEKFSGWRQSLQLARTSCLQGEYFWLWQWQWF